MEITTIDFIFIYFFDHIINNFLTQGFGVGGSGLGFLFDGLCTQYAHLL